MVSPFEMEFVIWEMEWRAPPIVWEIREWVPAAMPRPS